MVNTCWVAGCKNRFVKGGEVGFYRFPTLKEADRRNLWIRAVKRSPNLPLDKRICGKHFQTGKPSKDPNHPDFIPNVFPWGRSKASAAKYEARKVRSEKRAALSSPVETSAASTSTDAASTNDASKPVTLVSISFGPIWQRKEREKLYRLKTRVKQENEVVTKLNTENLKSFSNIFLVKEILPVSYQPNVDHQETCSFEGTGQCSCSIASFSASELLKVPCPKPSQEPVTTKPNIQSEVEQENEEVAKLNTEKPKSFSNVFLMKEILPISCKPNVDHQETCSFKSTGHCSCSMASCSASELRNVLCPKPSQEPVTTKPTIIRMHSNGERHECKICHKSFIQAAQLIIHRGIHHSNKHYWCVICGKSFNLAHRLREHVWMHTGEKPYKCDICGKSFAQEKSINTHKKLHMLPKPYVCEVCKMAFTYVDQLERHRSIHYAKVYMCDICNASFLAAGARYSHKLKEHSEKTHRCEFCEKTFPLYSRLKRHRMSHIKTDTNIKNYACDICDKSFAQSSTRNRHRLTHTKEKPYACKVCCKEFASRSYLNKHMRTSLHREKLNSFEHQNSSSTYAYNADRRNYNNEEN